MMDTAILTSLLRTDYFPPTDVWYSTEPINYYYFGHMLVASLSQLTFVPAQYGVNLGIAATFALCILLAFSLVWQLTHSIVAAGMSAFLLTLSSNLDPAIASLRRVEDYIFFSATRLDPYTINEFPLYSFVVADMHAHTLGLPLALGIITLLYVVIESPKLHWPVILALALLIGATGPTNSFDLIVYGALTALVFVGRQYLHNESSWSRSPIAILQALGVGVLALALYLPFYINFEPPVGGVGVQLFQTPLDFILINFGILLLFCLPILPMSLPPLSFLHLSTKERLQIDLPTKKQLLGSDWFVILLIITGLLMILATEFVYLKDIYTYQNPPYARANTIFKVYFQVWVMLSIAAGYGWYLSRHVKLKWHLNDAYILLIGVAVALSLIGTKSAIQAYAISKPMDQPAWSLDGYRYLQYENPDQLALIHYINSQIEGQPHLLEAAGESYTQRSRISAYTGLPTPLGWASHQWGWRYHPQKWEEIAALMGQIELAYTTDDPAALQQILNDFEIDYIVATDVEREQYQVMDFTTLETVAGEPVFEQGNYALYHIAR